MNTAQLEPSRPIQDQPLLSPNQFELHPLITPPNCPPGLQHLAPLDQLLIYQRVELLEVFVGFETRNFYHIRNSQGEDVFSGTEQSDMCVRRCCGRLRSFEMKLCDSSKNEVIQFDRPLAGQGCLFPCCLQSLQVSSPPGNLIGSVEEEWSVVNQNFKVKNGNGDVVFGITGPCWTCSCLGDVDFAVFAADGGEEVGKITKVSAGCYKDTFTMADNFRVHFRVDLNIRMKAVLLGALFLIDYMFYEKVVR